MIFILCLCSRHLYLQILLMTMLCSSWRTLLKNQPFLQLNDIDSKECTDIRNKTATLLWAFIQRYQDFKSYVEKIATRKVSFGSLCKDIILVILNLLSLLVHRQSLNQYIYQLILSVNMNNAYYCFKLLSHYSSISSILLSKSKYFAQQNKWTTGQLSVIHLKTAS